MIRKSAIDTFIFRCAFRTVAAREYCRSFDVSIHSFSTQTCSFTLLKTVELAVQIQNSRNTDNYADPAYDSAAVYRTLLIIRFAYLGA